MAKIEYEVGVKTDAAKRKIQRDLGTVEAGGDASTTRPSSGGTQVAASADKAAKSLNHLGDNAEKSSSSISRAVKGFAGIGVSMAASYAANALPQGSAARTALDYGGNIAGGAISGSAFGPWGAVIGGIVGGAKTYLEHSGEQNAHSTDFFKSELRNSEAVAWKERLEGLTDLGDSPSEELLEQKLQEVRDAIAQKKEAEAQLVDDIKKYIEEGKYESSDFARNSLAINRQQQEQLQAAEKQMRRDLDGLQAVQEAAASLSPTDALSRVGGDFAGAQSAAQENIARNTSQANTILGRIERKISKGGTF